ncbi:MAG: hypothetical protein DKM50_03310 [Candidatus Margulisiibacteriota bacterium]|nr:MAG: hypothetical protein A2X43_09450 [Candidatus Margulisbacteria bacterium GWD2_39_127]OGI02885.1 MAG: hypothetical protein A2X42_02315 [Candidatus Margulisbacteria bacterium GWF2_38_17]OGI06819.1 MAG: hypothetical protein A2X41_03665 [Candidatus Margulisbacteria bacterium GWE2_39_32]PZM83007.1 MAG: hypothetical protein DKM50_03310 [Candidatus Margulisiibacteriota bacterium]HAR62167.1 hypothetical protein [Candidatus Margulisiibacteriota bacterium]
MNYFIELISNFIVTSAKIIYLYFAYLVMIIIFLLIIFSPAVVLVIYANNLLFIGIIIFFYPHFLSFFFSSNKKITNPDSLEEEVEKDTYSKSDNSIGIIAAIIFATFQLILFSLKVVENSSGIIMLIRNAPSTQILLIGVIFLITTLLKLDKKF